MAEETVRRCETCLSSLRVTRGMPAVPHQCSLRSIRRLMSTRYCSFLVARPPVNLRIPAPPDRLRAHLPMALASPSRLRRQDDGAPDVEVSVFGASSESASRDAWRQLVDGRWCLGRSPAGVPRREETRQPVRGTALGRVRDACFRSDSKTRFATSRYRWEVEQCQTS